MKDDHDPKEPGKEEATPAMDLKRRQFLKTLGLVGGGLLAYSTPMVQASGLGARLQATSAVRFFDVATPAQYSVDEPSVPLDLVVSGRTVTVDFHAVGSIGLSKTTDPDVSRVQILSLQLQSNDPNPLGVVGQDDGRLFASVPAKTDIGQLNHKTGVLAETPFPITLTSEKGGTISTQVQPGKAQVTENTTTQKKCTKKNDVHIQATPELLALGTLQLGLTPSVISGGTTTA